MRLFRFHCDWLLLWHLWRLCSHLPSWLEDGFIVDVFQGLGPPPFRSRVLCVCSLTAHTYRRNMEILIVLLLASKVSAVRVTLKKRSLHFWGLQKMNWPRTQGLLTETIFKPSVLSVFLFSVVFFPHKLHPNWSSHCNVALFLECDGNKSIFFMLWMFALLYQKGNSYDSFGVAHFEARLEYDWPKH